MNEYVRVNDVAPRDGLQNQSRTLEVAERVRLIESLVEAGVSCVEIGSFVSPKAVPQMAGSAEVAAGLPRDKNCFYTGLAPNMRGYEGVRDAGLHAFSIPVSATETMNQKNLHMSIAQIMQTTTEIIERARADRIRSVVYLCVAFECPFEGRVPETEVLKMAGQLFDAGTDELVIADTIGAAAPNAVHSLMTQLCREYDAQRLVCHFHDTRALALANSYAALEAGIRKFDSSTGGLGGCPFAPGAAGNLATEDLVLLLHQMGFHTGIDLAALLKTVRFLDGLIGPVGGRSRTWLQGQIQTHHTLPQALCA